MDVLPDPTVGVIDMMIIGDIKAKALKLREQR
jgi:hypothetical protein